MKSYLALIAVGLDAAATRFKSKIKETAASVAAAFVGIGLFTAPIDSVQANHRNKATPATVSYVDLVGFLNPAQQPSVTIDFPNSEFGDWWGAKIDVTSEVSTTGLYQGGYVIIFHDPCYPTPFAASGPLFEDGDGWVEVWIWMGGPGDPPVAWVHDSTNSDQRGGSGIPYQVDLYVDGFFVSGPSWPYGY